jgi:hypothetical protein
MKYWNMPQTNIRKPIPIMNGMTTVLPKVRMFRNISASGPPVPSTVICAETIKGRSSKTLVKIKGEKRFINNIC